MCLTKLDPMTPGDFSTVLCQARVARSRHNARRLVTVLGGECQAKQHGMKLALGFVL